MNKWKLSLCVALAFIWFVRPSVAAEPALEESIRQYGEFLQTLESNQQISQQVADQWIARLWAELDQSENQVLNQSGWLAVMSLMNLHHRWDEALMVCDIAIDTAVDPEVRFDRLADRVAILQARAQDGSRAMGDATPLLDAIKSFSALAHDKVVARSRGARYASLAWSAARQADIPQATRRQIAGEFLGRVRSGLVNSHPVEVKNFRGLTAGLLIASDTASAVDLVRAEGSAVESDNLVVQLALQHALEAGASSKQRADFLFAVSSDMGADAVLSAAVSFVATLLTSDENLKTVAKDGEAGTRIDGVSVYELIQLMVPAVDALVTKHGTQQSAWNANAAVKQERLLTRTATHVLAELYTLDGDATAASYYRGIFKRIPHQSVEDLQRAP